jgi:hypothetical protein
LPPNRVRIARYAIYQGKITEPSYPRRADTPNRILGTLTPRYLRDRITGAAELRNEVRLLRCQLRRNRAHLLIDVVLAKPLGEGRELALDIGGLLCLQLRRAELMVAGTVTGGAWRNAACGIPGKGQANGRIGFPKGVPGLKTLADKGRQAVGAACELSADIDRGLRRQAVSARYSNRAGRRRLGSRCNEGKGARALPQLRPRLSTDRQPSRERAPPDCKNTQIAGSTPRCIIAGVRGPDKAHARPQSPV